MKEKFAEWAKRAGVQIAQDWTVEQICDALISAGAAWPDDLTNEQGWQLWTAVIRRECHVQSVQWLESPESAEFTVVFRLEDKRVHEIVVPKTTVETANFGAICMELEGTLREWKVADDAAREQALAAVDAAYALQVPDLMDYVIGFRAWNVNGARLKPIGMGGDVWEGGSEVRASCAHGRLHRSPDPECECGLYAWHSWAAVSANSNKSQVYGAVRAWGRMEIHNDGFRAEYMKPVLLGYDDSEDRLDGELSPPPDRAHLASWVGDVKSPKVVRGPDYHRVKAISSHLGDIPVVPYREMERHARDFGLIVADNPHLLPPPESASEVD